jgi:zinc-binding in reverse transcriptase
VPRIFLAATQLNAHLIIVVMKIYKFSTFYSPVHPFFQLILLSRLKRLLSLLNRGSGYMERGIHGFTVKSFYSFLQNTPVIKSQISNIWRLKLPPRVLLFTWLRLKNSILTTDNLRKRGWQIPSLCYMCY